jgi:polyphosphate kinase
VEALEITWVYDPLASLFMLEDLGITAVEDAELSAAERERLAAYQTDWIEGFEGDSYLNDGTRRVGLSGPQAARAELVDGKVAISFRRTLEAPLQPGAETVVRLYDPTYFTAYFVTLPATLEGAPAGCATRVVPFEPDTSLAALQQSLMSLGIDETPEDPDIGALFADKVFVTCG